MKIKLVIVLLLMAITSLAVLMQSQPQENSKGGFNVQAFEVSKGNPHKPSSAGISTGIVSELPKGESKWAIIIGISDYAGTANDLDYCDDDARDFYYALTVTYGWSEKNIIMLIDENATRTKILDAIAWVAARENEGDEVVFFYSGHGSVSNRDMDGDEERKDECIVPWEATFSSLIWDGELKHAFANFESTRILFYFDSCYSGGMTDLEGAGRLVLMACEENQVSLESSAWQNGQFTYYFVDKGMINKLADKNEDRKVTFEEAFDFAKANCRKQTPTASDNFENDILP